MENERGKGIEAQGSKGKRVNLRLGVFMNEI